MGMGQRAEPQQLRPVVTLTGAAKESPHGPPLGVTDIGESEHAYLFQIALPGVKSHCDLKCDVHLDGKVHIEGVVSEIQSEANMSEYEKKLEQLCPPGPFTVTFKLPGPVDPRLFSPNFRSDGILEAVVWKKFHAPGVPGQGNVRNSYNFPYSHS